MGAGSAVGDGDGRGVAVTAAKVGVRLEAAKVAVGDAGKAVGSAGAVVQAAKQVSKKARPNALNGMCGIIAGQLAEIKETLKLGNWLVWRSGPRIFRLGWLPNECSSFIIKIMSKQTLSGSGNRAGMLTELLNNAHLTWKLLLDPKVNALAKLVPAAALAYLIMPIDVIPDMIPGLGQLDDIAIILLGIRAFIALCPPELVQWYRGELGIDPKTQENQSDTIEGSYRVVDE